jgi:hypothetical protein
MSSGGEVCEIIVGNFAVFLGLLFLFYWFYWMGRYRVFDKDKYPKLKKVWISLEKEWPQLENIEVQSSEEAEWHKTRQLLQRSYSQQDKQ